MKIGELGTRHGISVDTVRFYEKKGLITPSARSEAGYRIYTKSDSERLAFILRAKSVGFNLEQVRELLQIEDNRSAWNCEDVKTKVEEKMREIETQVTRLQGFHDSLKRLSDACCGGPLSAQECSILNSLEKGDLIKEVRQGDTHQNHSEES